MSDVDVPRVPSRPSTFARLLLHALDGSFAHSRRRKRDQKPDEIGLSLKRVLLERVVSEDPDPDVFGDWLLEEVLSAPSTGPQRAIAAELLGEYHLAMHDRTFARWLADLGCAAGEQVSWRSSR